MSVWPLKKNPVGFPPTISPPFPPFSCRCGPLQLWLVLALTWPHVGAATLAGVALVLLFVPLQSEERRYKEKKKKPTNIAGVNLVTGCSKGLRYSNSCPGVLRSFSDGSCYEHHSFYLTINWGFYPPQGREPPTIFVTVSWDRMESPLPARRSQGASMLELNSLAISAALSPLSDLDTPPSHNTDPLALFRATPTRDKGRDGKILIHFPSLQWRSPIQALTSPNVA